MAHYSVLPANLSGTSIQTGFVGQYIFANSSSNVNFFDGSSYPTRNLMNISLTPGKWLLQATIVTQSFTGDAIGINYGISTSTTGWDSYYVQESLFTGNYPNNAITGMPTQRFVTITANTTYYLIGKATNFGFYGLFDCTANTTTNMWALRIG